MEVKFQVESEPCFKDLLKTTRPKIAKRRNILMVFTTLAFFLSAAMAVFAGKNGVVSGRDIRNVIITVIMLILVYFLPHLLAQLQLNMYKKHGMDGKRIIYFYEDSFEVEYEKYQVKNTYGIDEITSVAEHYDYYDLALKTGITHLEKKYFVKGNPDEFQDFINKKINE